MISTTTELPSWRRWLAYAAVATMPLSVNLERIQGPLKRPFYLSPLDVLLPILALLLLLDLLASRAWARVKFPAAATIIWAAVSILSCAWMEGFPKNETFHDWVWAAFSPLWVLVIPAWIFANIASSAAEYRRLLQLLLASFGVCVTWALIQYIGPVGLPFNPDDPKRALNGVTNMRLGGWYDNRMLFAAQVAMLIPAAAALAALDSNVIVRVLCALLSAIALCVTMAIGGVLGALGGVAAVLAGCILLRRNIEAGLLGVCVLLLIVVVYPRLPEHRNNSGTLQRGLSLIAPVKEGDDKKAPTARLRRYQAALDYFGKKRNWIFGAGAGRYNSTVNQYYDEQYYPKPGKRTDDEAAFDMDGHERDGFGLLEKTGVELGTVGLLALAFLFGNWILSATSVLGSSEMNEWRTLALAALGAGVGAAIVSVFLSPVQRGAGSGGTFAFMLALAYRAWIESAPKIADKENS